ncbi:Uncharacterized protein Adt_05543 [Abeliophyllum distichum]|uniref:Uncharacterized protein n=1 Tax=Abeliophyllum distichum TaxID=126358 RepID=A0ABD1V4N1_9LAMI
MVQKTTTALIRSWNDLSVQFVSNFMGARARSTPKKYLPHTEKFLARAKKYISGEKATSDQENEKYGRKDSVKGKERDYKLEKKESPKKTPDFQHLGRTRPIPDWFQGYHILNTSLENVLLQTKGKNILKKSTSMRVNSSELNQKKYCRYHRSVGHDTNDCRYLKSEIESLIRLGHLREFLARPTGGADIHPPHDRTELPLSPPLPLQQGQGEQPRVEIRMIVEESQYLGRIKETTLQTL